MLFIIFILILVTVGLFMVLLLKKGNRLKEGYFINMMNGPTAATLAAPGSTYNLVDGCSRRGTCGAYSFINNKTAPFAFIVPKYASSGIGILFDNSLWPLITNFSLVDGDTYSRNTCSEESSTFSYGNTKAYPTKCDSEDTDCMILNSGGSPSFRAAPCFSDPKKCDDTCLNPQICSDSQVDKIDKYTDIITQQCKYVPQQFKQWLKDLHYFYGKMLDGTFTSKNVPFFENEFNIYIYPDNTHPMYQKQNAILQDSIVGVIYTDIALPYIAEAIAENLSKQLGRSIPAYQAALIPCTKDATDPNVAIALRRAIEGEYRWKDIFY